jgi:hypothetical protein
MAGKIKMPEDELDDPSLLVPETPDQTHHTFVNPEHRLRRLESIIDEYEDTQKAILQKLNLPHIIQSLILVLYGPAQSDMSRKVRVGPDELKYIIKGGPRYMIFLIYGWAHHHIILLSTIHYG